MKKLLTDDEAISLLPAGDTIHTFRNMPFGLIGADWSKEDIIEELRKAEVIEITGETARSMNHGLAIYNKNAKYQSDILFIETNKEKLDQLDPPREESK